MVFRIKYMLQIIYILSLCIIIFPQYTNAQTDYFIVEKAATVKNYKFVAGDKISLMYEINDSVVSSRGIICTITDSTIVINETEKIPLNSIREVYIKRQFFAILSEVGWKAGVGYFAVDGINGLLTKRAPVIPIKTLFITGGLFASSFFSKLFTVKTIKTDGKKWKVKALVYEDYQ